jgi:hypothetical protein
VYYLYNKSHFQLFFRQIAQNPGAYISALLIEKQVDDWLLEWDFKNQPILDAEERY